jgi:crotonobetainyl-CoA:carnitine CoA-transferase CaiB-like acyl-CoA transferase
LLPLYLLGHIGAGVADQVGDLLQVTPWRTATRDWNGTSAAFLSTNRSKRRVVLDLDDARHRDTLLDLIAHADIVVEADQCQQRPLERQGTRRGAIRSPA